MMSELHRSFLADAAVKAADKEHRRKINFNISKYEDTFKLGLNQYADLDLAKKRAKAIKWKTIENLDNYLGDFEAKFTQRGGKVIWAEDAEQAIKEILKIMERVGTKSVVKAKSMTTEEIHLNEALEKNNIEVHETDLGEYIVQMANEKPYHIVTPAMHKSREDVIKLFHAKLGTPMDLSPEELTMIAREQLREKYLQAEVGISGANFIISDTGSVAVTENEGNARLTTTFPKVHIVIVGIEKVIPSIHDLSLFWPLLATHGTGQYVTVYNTLFSGPRQEGEVDGPEEMHVILLDNGRTNLLAKTEQRQALYCIRCGACLNVCPIYKNIGGHAYNTTYSGPIGSIITPHFRGMEQFKHLSFASTLCGSCSEICPVKIDLHHLLLLNRRDIVNKGLVNNLDKWSLYFWKKAMLNRKILNIVGAGVKNFFLRYLLKNSWGKRRVIPPIAKRSFNKLWKSRHKK